jgi:integrase
MRGHIARRPSGRYAVVVELDRDPITGKRRQRWHGGYRTKKEAEQALTELLGRIQRGEYVMASTETVGDYLDIWLDTIRQRVRPSTWEGYHRYVQAHIKPALGSVRLQRLTPADLNAFYADLLDHGKKTGKGGPLKARTVRLVHTIIRRALKDAVRWGKITRNIADLADPPSHRQTKPPEMQTWTADELRAFLTHVQHDRLYALWHLASMTGMRRGELLGLRWEDVDLDSGRVAVRRALVQVRSELVLSEPKTTQGRRSVAIDPATVVALRDHRAAQDVERALFGDAYEESGFVFNREDGRPIQPELGQRLVRPAREGGQAATDQVPRPAPYPRHTRTAGRRPPQGGRGSAGTRRSRAHLAGLLARDPRTAGDDRGARRQPGVGGLTAAVR